MRSFGSIAAQDRLLHRRGEAATREAVRSTTFAADGNRQGHCAGKSFPFRDVGWCRFEAYPTRQEADNRRIEPDRIAAG
jgi:hypothetical protein